jgi:hypothetical protein
MSSERIRRKVVYSFDCSDCQEETSVDAPFKEKDYTCQAKGCTRMLCTECQEGTYKFEEWLEVDTACSKCHKVVCRECLSFCYDCANERDDDFTVLCKDCAGDQFQNVECKYHAWEYCAKHRKDKVCYESAMFQMCDACRANRKQNVNT